MAEGGANGHARDSHSSEKRVQYRVKNVVGVIARRVRRIKTPAVNKAKFPIDSPPLSPLESMSATPTFYCTNCELGRFCRNLCGGRSAESLIY